MQFETTACGCFSRVHTFLLHITINSDVKVWPLKDWVIVQQVVGRSNFVHPCKHFFFNRQLHYGLCMHFLHMKFMLKHVMLILNYQMVGLHYKILVKKKMLVELWNIKWSREWCWRDFWNFYQNYFKKISLDTFS